MPRVPRWSDAEKRIVRFKWKTTSKREIVKLLPRRTYKAIKNQAATMGIYKGRPPFAVTKDPVLNAIRLRCRKMMITLRDLDWHLQTHVFKLSGHTKVRIKPYWLLKAIRFLGGRFTPDGQVVWV